MARYNSLSNFLRRLSAAGVMVMAVDCNTPSATRANASEEGSDLPYTGYGGYFVSNQFEPDAAQSFLVIQSQADFDKVFGTAVVMRDKSHRLPKDAFTNNLVVAAIYRGNALREFQVEQVSENSDGIVLLRYTTLEKLSDTATFACPLIVSIPKKKYRSVQFLNNGIAEKEVTCETP